MVLRGFRWAYRSFGGRYVRGSLVLLHGLAFAVVLAGIGLLTIYQPLGDDFWTVVLIAEGLLAVETAFALAFTARLRGKRETVALYAPAGGAALTAGARGARVGAN